MKFVTFIDDTEAATLSAGDATATAISMPIAGITSTSPLAQDMAYLAGVVVGAACGVWVTCSNFQPISIVDWKVGVVPHTN